MDQEEVCGVGGTAPKAVASSGSGRGFITKFFFERGYGFVTPDDGTDDVFVHVKDNPDLVDCLHGGAVCFDLAWDDRKGNYKGINLASCRLGRDGADFKPWPHPPMPEEEVKRSWLRWQNSPYNPNN